ncbi:OmpA family protein [Qipengyuania sp. JC766]|uniref:OmpA family protein n=1 Tax=Qipengyuania sp. JC766 TaxID=3232139 RepID=UPI003457BF96
MNIANPSRKAMILLGLFAATAPVGLAAQDAGYDGDVVATAYGSLPDRSEMTEGPEIEGIISARKGNRIQITSEDGTRTVVNVDDQTEIKASGGFLGLGRERLASDQLLNGLPVSVETLTAGGVYLADEIDLKQKDLKMAAMIAQGTEQGFAEQTAATDALRTRVGDIDQYNVKGTTNVYFDTGEYDLTQQSRAELCSAAAQANSMENALLLVVGYTDTTGTYEINQELSEKRAERVVNYLQQQCGWKPYRMLTPTGMATADPAADNFTEEGRAQNRRVAVNILVSKSVDGL